MGTEDNLEAKTPTQPVAASTPAQPVATPVQAAPLPPAPKKHSIALIVLGSLFIIMVLLGIIAFLILKTPNYDAVYEERISLGEISNPALEYVDEDAATTPSTEQTEDITNEIEEANLTEAEEEVFQMDLVEYMLIQLKAYNLKAAPFGGDNPKLVLYIGDNVFSSEIIEGEIDIVEGKISGEDLIIRTTQEEAIKMSLDEDYIFDSFNIGHSTVETVADQKTLLVKGYLNMYNQITGE